MHLFRSSALAALLLLFACGRPAQDTSKFRNGIFLHHSTGKCIWYGSPRVWFGFAFDNVTSVPREIAKYNAERGLVGPDRVTLDEEQWPMVDNEWATWHRIFENRMPDQDIRPYLENNRIVVVKSCFPSSYISGVGDPSDTLAPDSKTVYNFKWHWRGIVSVMRRHPRTFFVIWTNAPQVVGQITDADAARSDWVCRWAKDTLANGLDAEFGGFPKNVYVFDFFHKLVDTSNKLPLKYARRERDSHPNPAASAEVAPLFVRETFDAAIAYERTITPQVSR